MELSSSKPRLSIRARLTLLLILVALAPLTLTTIAGLDIQAEHAENALADKNLTALHDVQSVLAEHARRAENLAKHLAGLAQGNMSREALKDLLADTTDFWFMAMVEIFDKDRHILARSETPLGDGEAFATGSSAPVLVGAINLERQSDYAACEKGLSIKAASPILDRATLEAVGAVVVTYPLDTTFLRMVKSSIKTEITLQWKPSGEAASTFVFGDGRPLTKIWPTAQASFTATPEPIAMRRESILGTAYATAYTPIRNLKGGTVAILSTSSSTAAMEADEKGAMTLFLYSASISMLVAAVIGLATAMYFTRPVYKLLEAIRFLSRGHLESRVALRRNDEIGDLSLAFDEMAERLGQNEAALIAAAEAKEKYAQELEASNRRLSGFNQALEDTVRQRTEELSRRNQVLTREARERENAEKLLRESERRFMDIIDFLPDATFVIDREGRVIAWNKAIEELSGVDAKDIVGKTDYAHALSFYDKRRPLLADMVLAGGTVPEGLYDKVERIGNGLRTETTLSGFRGKDLHLWIVATPLYDSEGKVAGAIESIRDITDRVRAEQEVAHHAYHDILTGLPNRALLSDRLAQAMARAARNRDHIFAVLLIDLDRFKLVNDTLGHLAGDQLLLSVARRLERVVRGVDTVSRLGGDEFVIVLDGIASPRKAMNVASRLLKSLEQPILLDGDEVFTSASVGVVLGNGYTRAEDILRDADIAMYKAKELGRNRFKLFHGGLREQVMRRVRLETDLRRAVEREEFILHYQPIVALDTGSLIGFEALMRWSHPHLGILSPSEFMAKAEETGLILPMGRQILFTACARMREWSTIAGPDAPLYVSVNLSSRQLDSPELIATVEQALQETGLEPERLRLEITESALMKSIERNVHTLGRIRDLGIKIDIDDFGTGYSSLSYLQQFPADTIKIDMSFVRGLAASEENQRIVQAVITLGRGLGLDTVAEGVETEDDRRRLQALGCELGQGYLFSKPLPEEDVQDCIRKRLAPAEAAHLTA